MGRNDRSVDESIYHLIPRDKPPARRPRVPISNYPPTIVPTSSTFGPAATSMCGFVNLVGNIDAPKLAHQFRHTAALLGPKTKQRERPDNFLKKHCKHVNLPQPTKFVYRENTKRKAPVPDAKDCPLFGLVSTKNFVKSNAIRNILSVPCEPPREKAAQPLAGRHGSFAKIPEYLNQVKEEIAEEYDFISKLHNADEIAKENSSSKVTTMPLEERQELVHALKQKWDHINRRYQLITHRVILDTISEVRRKEQFEKDLRNIEADIEKLSKPVVLVRLD